MSERSEYLIQRMEKLERSNWRMKLLGIAAVAVLSIGATQSQSKIPDVVQAKRFQVVNGNGKVLVDIGPFGDKDHSVVAIFDRKGVLRASIGITDSDNAAVVAYDHTGTVRTASVAVESGTFKGNSGHFVYDENGALRTSIDYNVVADFTGFDTEDANGHSRVVAGMLNSAANSEFMNLMDANGNLRTSLAADFDSTGGTGLTLGDKNGVFRAAINIDSTQGGGAGNEALAFVNPQNNLVGSFLSGPGQGGTFTANDANGNPIGHLP
jgi:hypothetical protein